MSLNTSLYTVKAVVILDNEAKRLYAKYFKPPHSAEDATASPFQTLKSQQSFETALFKKTHKINSDIILFDNHIVLYKEFADVVIYLVGDLNENEVLLMSCFSGLVEAFNILLKNALDKKSITENYDMVVLAIDETIDDGIILETDSAVIASRVTGPPSADAINLAKIDLSEKGLFSAFNFARAKIGERLQQL
ncbi:hypothetical protein BABINDRAFT_159235 [Babjeviella inositovora NRRL Y-12698]|uniref:Coatomer subunit zeta n=1 Tax=Babjeviella inositovora NRRL Y-12698 TaxID=984486 RepID=A0A1E3QYG1_9ASCO|nr:uncharacterized protein BABINDRAFT_159235 [Babjeviella inositovora NRRL Y-12698]ODQ82710.1 hypothetical protein BABINDRAFT_159235 [Babjeviella inositovora NRRL Y-12698]